MNKKEDIIKTFLQSVHDAQRIIHKICKIYRDNKADQEDLYQEIVYQLWLSYPSFKGEAKISSWIYRIALNTALIAYRKRMPSIKYLEAIPEGIHPASDPEDPSEKEEKLFALLRRLEDAEKALIALYLEDYSYREIAQITGLTENNVGVKLNRIKAKLKQLSQ